MIDAVIILAGGSGTRLWPASTKKSPKQFMKLAENTSLLRLTVERAFAVETVKEVIIVTLQSQLGPVISDCREIETNGKRFAVIPEPAARNTAPAIALACTSLKLRGKGRTNVLVLAADHLISPTERFVSDAKKAGELAERGFLVTFGIPPRGPATGYGYIEAGEREGSGFRVLSFKEKPDRAAAEEFVRAGNFYWNSGMFCFKADSFLSELKKYRGDIASVFEKIETAPRESSETGIIVSMRSSAVDELYQDSPSDSIDYAVMEKSSAAAMVETGFDWNDIGSWDEVARLGLTEGADVLSADSEDNFVYSDMPVALCGVNDLIVVVKNGTVLICKKGESQKVKQIVGKAKDKNREDIL